MWQGKAGEAGPKFSRVSIEFFWFSVVDFQALSWQIFYDAAIGTAWVLLQIFKPLILGYSTGGIVEGSPSVGQYLCKSGKNTWRPVGLAF